MHVVVLCQDKPGSAELRAGTRAVHLDYLKAHGTTVALAGPFLDPQSQPVGSMLVLDVPDLAAAQAFAAADPYAQAGLFASVEIRPWRWTVNTPQAFETAKA